jgi:hypothetical protein
MNGTMYLVDNNALGPLRQARKESAFFAAYCRVPAEVAHESRRAKHSKLLEPLAIEMTPPMLVRLTEVMSTVPVGDTTLLDLYGNKGAADPVLVAVALALNNPEPPSLFDPTWVIVSADKAVLAKAKEFSIDTESPEGLARIIDASMR